MRHSLEHPGVGGDHAVIEDLVKTAVVRCSALSIKQNGQKAEIMLHGFAFLSVILLEFFPKIPFLVIFISLCIAEFLSYRLNNSKCRIELFSIPIFISFVLFFAVLLFASVYPPNIFPFI